MSNEGHIINFRTFYDPMLAHIIRTRLQDNGIECFISDETLLVLILFITRPLAELN